MRMGEAVSTPASVSRTTPEKTDVVPSLCKPGRVRKNFVRKKRRSLKPAKQQPSPLLRPKRHRQNRQRKKAHLPNLKKPPRPKRARPKKKQRKLRKRKKTMSLTLTKKTMICFEWPVE